MWKIRKWFEKKSASKKEYEEEKKEFEMAIGRPFITLKIELPEKFEDQRRNREPVDHSSLRTCRFIAIKEIQKAHIKQPMAMQ